MFPLDLKRLRRLIAKNEIGTLEIKVQGRGHHAGDRFDASSTCDGDASGDPARDRRRRARPGRSWLTGPRRAARPARRRPAARRAAACDST